MAAAPILWSRLLNDLAVDREIEPFPLGVGVDAQPDDEINELQQDQRGDRVIDDGASDAVELNQDLVRIAVDQAAMAFAADRRDGQNASQDRAGRPADAMHAERIQAVIVAERVLQAD